MNDPAPSAADLGLKSIEGKSFEFMVEWLDRALRGKESLPLVIPDEPPEAAILRRERSLNDMTRQDLRNACRTLVRRFVKAPKDDDDFVSALLQLARGFDLQELVTDLFALAGNPEAFLSLPAPQIKSVLFTMLDLRAPLPLDFWKAMAAKLPGSSAVITISGLLTHGYESAAEALPKLPDDEAVADSLYVILDQHSGLLNPAEIGKMAKALNAVQADCAPQIREVIKEWSAAHPVQMAASIAPEGNSKRARLMSALAAKASSRNEKFELRPQSARLIPVPQAA